MNIMDLVKEDRMNSPFLHPLPQIPQLEDGLPTIPPRHFSLSPRLEGTNGGTWSSNVSRHAFFATEGKSSLLDSHDRFKPEKNQRRAVQKMKWGTTGWTRSLAGDLFSSRPQHSATFSCAPSGFQMPMSQSVANALPLESESRVSSMTIADVSPRIAVKKVLLLYEHAQYREAANFIHRLSAGTFRIILRELPVEVFVDSMPHSLPIIEALYKKVYATEGACLSVKALKPDSVVMHIVKFFSREEISPQNPRLRRDRDCGVSVGPFTSGCKEILRVIVMAEPKIMKSLQERRRALDKAVEGMGQHGLVGTTDESLLPLHDALKLEFRRVVDTYKGALQKLEDLSLSAKNNPKSVAHGPAPIQASHQRQLSLRAEEIQDRLIKNKSLLNVVEPTLDNHCLDILLGILERRIECDKETLFQFTQLKKEAGDTKNSDVSVVAPILMRYSRSCKQVIEMMKEAAREVGGGLEDVYEDDSSDLSGYHSDSDSAIMTSGNSPFVTPRARYNFLSRSLRSKAILRPSLLLSSSGVSSGGSRSSSGSSVAEAPLTLSLPPNEIMNDFGVANNGPTRPRHVKHRNMLEKNNSIGKVSTTSSGSTESETSEYISGVESRSGCIDCVTLVSVPDNQVISQGVNHLCVKSPQEVADGRELRELKAEMGQLRRSLLAANSTITALQEQRGKDGQKEARKNQLVREYGSLYAQARVETMDALDALPELSNADELKSKLLFSVVILSYRAVVGSVGEVKEQVKRLLQIQTSQGDEKSKGQERVIEAVEEFLRESPHPINLSRSVEQVGNQLWATLYDYPCLKSCGGLLKYIRTCVDLSFGFLTHSPPCYLEYEQREFSRDLHVRFHSSDPNSEIVKTYLWPALLEANGNCMHKGVVIT